MSNAISLRTPKYRRHKAKNLAVVTLAGREIYLGRYGSESSKQEYRRLIAEWMQTGCIVRANEHEEISIIEVIAAYLKFAINYYRKDGQVTREYGLIAECCKFVKSHYGRKPATEFGPVALKAVRQAMIDASHSQKYINKNIQRIRRMFRWAAGEEIISASIPQTLQMVTGLRKGRTAARETDPILPVSDEVVSRTIQHVPAVIRDMIRLQRLTGMRPQEVCMMRPTDIDRSGDIWIYRPHSHKTNHLERDRLVLLGKRAQQVLQRYLTRHPSLHCFRPVDSEKARRAAQHASRMTPLSCGNIPGSNIKTKPRRAPGECYDCDSYRRAIHRGCDRAFPHPRWHHCKRKELSPSELVELRTWQSAHRWSPNRLRHSAATDIRRQFGLEAAQIILGHSAADVTQVYAERDLNKGMEVARVIG
jgi:integrase